MATNGPARGLCNVLSVLRGSPRRSPHRLNCHVSLEAFNTEVVADVREQGESRLMGTRVLLQPGRRIEIKKQSGLQRA